jgi:hypothetical protein
MQISKDEKSIGLVVFDGHQSKVTPAEGADSNHLDDLRRIIETVNTKKSVDFSYSERVDDTHFSCGGSVELGSPTFADGLRWHLYSTYFDVKVLN